MYDRIEFLGLPGAGKSSLASRLLADCKSWNPRLYSHRDALVQCLMRRDDGWIRNALKQLPYKIWEPICGARNALAEWHAYASDNIGLLHLIFDVLDGEPMPHEWRSCILYVFHCLGSEHQLFSSHLKAGETVVVEEGFAQGSLSAFGYRTQMVVRSEEIDRYMNQLPPIQGVVCVDTHPAVCLKRLSRRLELPLILSVEEPGLRMARMEHLNRCMRMALASAERQGIPVCHVMNEEEPLDAAVRNVCNAYRSWVLKNGEPDRRQGGSET